LNRKEKKDKMKTHRLFFTFLLLAALVLSGCGANNTTNPPDKAPFSLEPAFTTLELPPGGEISSFVNLEREAGFTDTVEMTFQTGNLPNGFTQEWSRDSANGDCSFRLSVAENVAPGSYTLNLVGKPIADGTSPAIVNSQALSSTLVTKPIRVDIIDASLAVFTVSSDPNILEIAQGGFSTLTVRTKLVNGPQRDLTLSLEGAPSGMIAEFSRNPVRAGDLAAMKLVVASGVPTGDYHLKVKGVSGTVAFRSDLKVTVRPAADASFELALTNSSVTVIQGITPFFSPVVTHSRTFGFSAPVTLSLEDVPDGVTATLTKTTLLGPNDSAAVKFEAGPDADPDTYSVTVKGTGGGVVKTAPISLEVAANADRPAATNIGANALDPLFGPDGNGFAFSPEPGSVNAFVPLPNGKTLVAGGGQFSSTTRVMRLNPDGTQDLSFGVNGFAEDGGTSANAVTLLPGGQFAITGNFSCDVDFGCALSVAKYNEDGTLDRSFSGDGKFFQPFNTPAFGIFDGGNGRLLLVTKDTLVRLTPGGNFDPDFGNNGRKAINTGLGFVGSAIQDAGGRIVVAGGAAASTGPNSGLAVARFTKDGVLDEGFGGDGNIILNTITARTTPGIALDALGRVLLASAAPGSSPGTSGGFAVARLQGNDGALDSSFGQGGIVTVPILGQDTAHGVALRGDGKIVVVGSTAGPNSNNAADFAALRLLDTGALDQSFGDNGKFRFGFEVPGPTGFLGRAEAFTAVLALPDGKMLAGGSSNSKTVLARFNP
jgi:uncharacterized delta-60 repeat protein